MTKETIKIKNAIYEIDYENKVFRLLHRIPTYPEIIPFNSKKGIALFRSLSPALNLKEIYSKAGVKIDPETKAILKE